VPQSMQELSTKKDPGVLSGWLLERCAMGKAYASFKIVSPWRAAAIKRMEPARVDRHCWQVND
jgi:hypothetical protein